MTLEPVPTVPQAMAGEVQVTGGRINLAMTGGQLILVLNCRHPSIAEIDRSGAEELAALLLDAARQMDLSEPG